MMTYKQHGPSSDNATTTAGKRTTKLWGSFCPFWQSSPTAVTTTTSSSSSATLPANSPHLDGSNSSFNSSRIAPTRNSKSSSSSRVSIVARSIFPTKKRLRLDPANHLYFPNEPGKQVRSAVRIKNTSRSHVAFKFQTTAPKSCYMRPPGGILAPGEAIIATVFKFVEHPDNNEKLSDQKSNVKFKIMSLKVKRGVDYVPELFDEQKDQVAVERILRVAFIDPERPTPALEKLKRQLADADADANVEIRKKPPVDTGPRVVGGLIIDEWKERRKKYLAGQQVEAVDSL